MEEETLETLFHYGPQQRLNEQRNKRQSFEREQRRIARASGATDIAQAAMAQCTPPASSLRLLACHSLPIVMQVVQRYEYIQTSKDALDVARRKAEARHADRRAELSEREKVKADLLLLGVNRESEIDAKLARAEAQVAEQDARVEEVCPCACAVVP